MSGTSGGTTGALTDGTGVSPLTGKKLLKDLVLDFLLTLAATLGVGAGFEAFDAGLAFETPQVLGIAVASAAIRALFRAALRWASTP